MTKQPTLYWWEPARFCRTPVLAKDFPDAWRAVLREAPDGVWITIYSAEGLDGELVPRCVAIVQANERAKMIFFHTKERYELGADDADDLVDMLKHCKPGTVSGDADVVVAGSTGPVQVEGTDEDLPKNKMEVN